MQLDHEEEKLLRSVALQNARAVLLARERAERELIQTKEALERKTSELGQQREWFAVTLSSIGDAVIATDTEGKVTFLNPVAESMTGWKSSEALGQPLETVFKIINEQTRESVEAPIARALRDGVVVGLANHTALVSKHGQETAIEDSAAPIKDLAGKITGAVMVFHDVTEKRIAESALKESEVRFRAIFNQAAVGMSISTLDGRYLQVNQRFCDILGYTPEDLRQHTFRDLTHPDHLPDTDSAVRQLVAGELAYLAFEKKYARKDGSFVWCLATVTLLKDPEGNPIYFVGVIEDITQRKKVEEDLRDRTRILELLNKTGAAIASQLDLQTLVQTVTDAGTELSEAKFGAFFYNVIDQQGESFLLYTLSGAPREAFQRFGMPRATPIFGPTFRGEGVVRSADITKDPRYGKMGPHHGMPKGHLPVRSYLAVPVISRSGEVIGGLFFGHPEPNVFTERAERLIIGIAAQAAVAIDNARLYETAQREIAERKRAEETVRQGAERLQLALAAGHLGNWSWDARTDIVTFGDQSADIFGLPRNTPITRAKVWELFHSEDAEGARRIVDKALADHNPFTVEYRFTRPSGEECWIISKGAGTYGDDGSITGMIGVIQDITEKKKADLDRERLISVLERSLNEIYIFDSIEFRFEYVNEGARKNLGYSMEEMRQMTPLDLKPEFTETTFRELVAPLLSGEKEKLVFYTWHRRRNKTLYPVEVHLQTVARERQRVFLAVILDITERKQAEETQSHLAAVVESSDDAIISKTLDGIITSWNRGAELMYGYSAEEVIGKPVTILIPQNMTDEEPMIIERLKQGKKIDHYETVRRRKDGTVLDVALTVSPIKDSSGKIIGASKIARDITERKRAERELQRAKDELEEKIQERTASLTETTEQLESFCYTIAHDLRSPLRAQQSFAQVLLEDYGSKLDSVGQEYAKRIMNSAHRLDKLVDDLLTYSRIARSEINISTIQLEKVVENVLGHLAEEITKRKATISTGPLLPVVAYEPTLNLVVTNLVANALKFVRSDAPPQIRIWSEAKGDFVRLWVEDNGIGIDPENVEKIFGVFQRLHPMDKYPGTGIGLAIVFKGIERIGGKVGVESNPGEGSRFWIELPKAE